ncbi:MAG: acyl-[acyl-carrier-protein] thioesterase [Tannerella sp.]|jgi:acyl-ACP thioesterase|nr:acyl-[acyl-carrier-protein] thioesterase [Tannerella sp.]
MDSRIGVYEYRTESHLLDFRGQLPLPVLGNYLLHAATRHAAGRGFGFDDMMERRATWVLSKLAVELTDPLQLADPLRILTWVQQVERIFTYRCFEITTLEGATLGCARSVWAAIDRETRRPVSLSRLGLDDSITARNCPVTFSSPEPAEKETEGIPYTVKYSDLDINGHLNSMKYIESILDLFDLDTFRTRSVVRFEIVYHAEGRYGMHLLLHKKATAEDEYAAAICNEGKPICRAKLRLGRLPHCPPEEELP